VDETIAQVAPHLEKGDILIDGGNTHFPDTTRRMKELAAKGIRLLPGQGQAKPLPAIEAKALPAKVVPADG